LLCGAATQEQASRLLEHLKDEKTFAGPYPLPNATRDDPAFADNVYWRGRIWPNVNYMVWLGLRRYGFLAEAKTLADQSHALFMQSWEGRRIAAENYNATTGEPLDQGDTDPFYIWAALLPLMAVGEVVDFNPWSGWTLSNSGRDVTLGPMLSPAGKIDVSIAAGVMSLRRNGRPFLTTTLRTTLSGIAIADAYFSCVIEPLDAPGSLSFPGIAANTVVSVLIDGKDQACSGSEGLEIEFSGSKASRRLDVYFRAVAGTV
jgi:putative isomerase